jgi:hypothetical protein
MVSIGTLILITSPWFVTLHKAIIGAYPTIDKEGSLLFFEHGVHHLWFTTPEMPLEQTGLTLIGIHAGHLWITEFFHIFVPSFVAFNLQMMLHLGLNVLSVLFWVDGWESIKEKEWQKWIVAILIGAQLHVFRDIHWYTIEKSALFPIFVFWGVLLRFYKADDNTHSKIHWAWLPISYGFAGMYNFYWAILLPFVSLAYVDLRIFQTTSKRLKGLIGCMGIGLFMGWIQLSIQSTEHYFADVTAFQQRAGLDIFNVSTLDWNRMGFWKPLNPLLIGMGLMVLVRTPFYFKKSTDHNETDDNQMGTHVTTTTNTLLSEWIPLMGVGILTTLLAMGPNNSLPFGNPVYEVFQWLPGMWRFAKPEIFLLVPYAILARAALNKDWKTWVWIAVVSIYVLGLYLSPAFPYTTEFVKGSLQF